MSIRDVTNQLRRLVDELEASVSGQSSDADCEEAMKVYLQSQMHGLASLAWFLGCDADVFSREAVPAGELAAEAYFEIHREREFEPAPRRRQYSAVAVGASL